MSRPRKQITITYTEGQARVVEKALEEFGTIGMSTGAWRHALHKTKKALGTWREEKKDKK